MMAPDYAHWHGMYEVAERFYEQLIPKAREVAKHAEETERKTEAEAVRKVIDEILARPEHQWFETGMPKPAHDAVRGSPPAPAPAGTPAPRNN
jgi:hypothetical protein